MVSKIFILTLIIFTNCKEKAARDKKAIHDTNSIAAFVPDTTINNRIKLLETVENIDFIRNKEIYYIKEDTAIIMSTAHDQKLILLRGYGGEKNEFRHFEISYNTENNKKGYNESTFDSFETESKIKLGITLDDVLNIKGRDYLSSQNNDVQIMEYKIDNYLISVFLKRYNMPIYNAVYTFKKGILIKYSFGFEMP